MLFGFCCCNRLCPNTFTDTFDGPDVDSIWIDGPTAPTTRIIESGKFKLINTTSFAHVGARLGAITGAGLITASVDYEFPAALVVASFAEINFSTNDAGAPSNVQRLGVSVQVGGPTVVKGNTSTYTPATSPTTPSLSGSIGFELNWDFSPTLGQLTYFHDGVGFGAHTIDKSSAFVDDDFNCRAFSLGVIQECKFDNFTVSIS